MVLMGVDKDFETDYIETPITKRIKTIRKRHGKNAFAKYGKKGGSVKTDKPRGWAYLKKYKPEYYKELVSRRKKK